MNLPRKQAGLSLIELMVAILISSLLLLGVLELYLNSSRADRTSNQLARIQENGRLVMELISREARRAGYQGCIAASTKTQVSSSISYPDQALAGTATSLTFRYARPTANGAFPHAACNGNALGAYEITFGNCGGNICVTAPDLGNNQQLVSNASISRVDYLEPCGGGTCAKAVPSVTTERVQVTLALTEASGEFAPRTFTSVIDLRNRL